MAGGRGGAGGPERDALRRRNALKQVLADYKLTPADVALGADLPNANAIYNFLNGRSRSLSQPTLEKIAAAIPGVTVAMLTGEGEPVGPDIVTIRAEAQAGRFRRSADLPLREQVGVSFPLSPRQIAAGAYGVIVRGPGAERLYPDGCLLACIPLSGFQLPLVEGQRLIVHRIRQSGVEVTVRELGMTGEKPWLWLRSIHPAFQQPVFCPWPVTDRAWRTGGDRLKIAGVVLGSYRSEVLAEAA